MMSELRAARFDPPRIFRIVFEFEVSVEHHSLVAVDPLARRAALEADGRAGHGVIARGRRVLPHFKPIGESNLVHQNRRNGRREVRHRDKIRHRIAGDGQSVRDARAECHCRRREAVYVVHDCAGRGREIDFGSRAGHGIVRPVAGRRHLVAVVRTARPDEIARRDAPDHEVCRLSVHG